MSLDDLGGWSLPTTRERSRQRQTWDVPLRSLVVAFIRRAFARPQF